MKRLSLAPAFSCALLLAVPSASFLARRAGASPAAQDDKASKAGGDSLNYADFEEQQGGRPTSTRGGYVQLTSYEETTKSHYKGLANASPGAPELVHIKQGDPNHAAAFGYELYSPNQYAGVGIEIHGQPDKDGKPVADDVSDYKFLSLQVYATGVSNLRVEFISRGQGVNLSSGWPQSFLHVRPGFNTYRVPLGSLNQPNWADKINPKDVLKKLTAVSITAFCEKCTPVQGTVVIDNVAFEKK